jgi:uncharacterized protein (TIGR03067 family)
MGRLFLLLATVGLLLGARGPASDSDRIQGKWRLLEHYSDRVTIPKEKLKMLVVVIKGDTIVMSDGTKEEQYTFTLDPKKMPPEINIREGKLPALPGIYELKGDTLRIVTADKRPKEFPKQPGGYTLLVLQRETK